MTIPDPALLAKADTLVEALPYLRRYAGTTFVVKYGGHAMGDRQAARDFADDIVLLRAVGIHPVVVHGGGPQIGAMLDRLGIESRFEQGLRVTDAATADVAEMVLAGAVNAAIVDGIVAAGGRAVGLSGKDAGLVLAQGAAPEGADPGALGFVGDPVAVDRRIIDTLVDAGMIPVIAPIAGGPADPAARIGGDADQHGPGDASRAARATYNLNADTMAGAIAAALGASRLFLLTDVPGVLDADGRLVPELDQAGVDALHAAGAITGGMIPKLRTCVDAVAGGVDAAVIIDGRVRHALLLEIFTPEGAGTLIRR